MSAFVCSVQTGKCGYARVAIADAEDAFEAAFLAYVKIGGSPVETVAVTFNHFTRQYWVGHVQMYVEEVLLVYNRGAAGGTS
jgi:hypothetical protein